jgi:hypothetical protein
MKSQVACTLTMIGLLATPALAASYPVSGKWTYRNAAASGPAKRCGANYMDFRGERRFDTGGRVSLYRNLKVSGIPPEWRVVDEFFSAQIRGHVTYTLRLVDDDHIAIKAGETGRRIVLRRCRR